MALAAQSRSGELLLHLDAVEIGGVQQFIRLFADSGGDRGVGVAEAVDTQAAEAIQVALADCVEQGARPLREKSSQAVLRRFASALTSGDFLHRHIYRH